MKKIFWILLLFMCAEYSNATAQMYPIVAVDSSSPVNTQAPNARYEFIQSTISSSQAFLIDNHTGTVWRYRGGNKKFEEILRDSPDSVNVNQINYQLYISGESSSMCFLLNIHTGQMWRYESKDGEKIFQKLDMPWISR